MAAGRIGEAIALHERYAQARARRSSVPTTPTRSPAATTSPRPTTRRAGCDEAIATHERTLELREAKLGPDHPDTLLSRNNLAAAYSSAGRVKDAIAMLEPTLELREAKLGPDHPDTLNSRNNLAQSYDAGGPAQGGDRHAQADAGA